MKRFLMIGVGLLAFGWAGAQTMPDNMYFRAMQDEMQRALANLRLQDQANPYYIAYWLMDETQLSVSANMGSLAPAVYDPENNRRLYAQVFVSVGSDKQDGLGFAMVEEYAWEARKFRLPGKQVSPSYDGIRQGLWQLTDQAYVQAVDLYKQKQAYKQKKNISDTLPDVVAEKPAHFVQEIKPFPLPDIERLKTDVQQISALGKTVSFVESFEANLFVIQDDFYFLNSRGAFAQYVEPFGRLRLNAVFRQADGKKSTVGFNIWLRDLSAKELARAKAEAEKFLIRIKQAHKAKSGEAYVGPVLLKPAAAARFIKRAVLDDIEKSKPFLLAYSDTDTSAGKLYKKRDLRVSTDLLTIYDRPLTAQFDGFSLARFKPVDSEGVAGQDLTLIANGHVQAFPLSQRPLDKKHHSNGHGFIEGLYGPREKLTNVFIEPKEQLTDEQMEEKLLARCRELGLEYGYILYNADPAGDLGIERIYTKDGRKETILDLTWDGNFFTQRDLRAVRAVGGEMQVAFNFGDEVLIAPSVLMDEVELVPQEHKPHRAPFVSRPK